MPKLKTSQIVGITIAMILIGILLPLGVNELTGFSNEVKSSSTSFTSQSTPQNYSLSLKDNEQLNVSVDYDSSGDDLLTLTAYYETNDSSVQTTSTDANTISIQFNSTGAHSYIIEVKNATTGSVSFNITMSRELFIEYDESVKTLITQVIPIIAVVGILIAFIPNKRN